MRREDLQQREREELQRRHLVTRPAGARVARRGLTIAERPVGVAALAEVVEERGGEAGLPRLAGDEGGALQEQGEDRLARLEVFECPARGQPQQRLVIVAGVGRGGAAQCLVQLHLHVSCCVRLGDARGGEGHIVAIAHLPRTCDIAALDRLWRRRRVGGQRGGGGGGEELRDSRLLQRIRPAV